MVHHNHLPNHPYVILWSFAGPPLCNTVIIWLDPLLCNTVIIWRPPLPPIRDYVICARPLTFSLWIILCLILSSWVLLLSSHMIIYISSPLLPLPAYWATCIKIITPPLQINPIIINHIANNLIDNISSLLRLLRAYSASSRRPGSRRRGRKRARTWSR